MGGASENMETAKHVEVDSYWSSTPELAGTINEMVSGTNILRQADFNDLNLLGHVIEMNPPRFIPANPPTEDASRLPPKQQYSAVFDEDGVTRERAFDLSNSRALFDPKEDALNRLYELSAECAEADWDGYGAKAVSQRAVERSAHFIRRLPEGLPLPEISVEPDGEIALDWSPTQTQTFSVSIGTADQMACAWVSGTEHGHVVVSSTNGEIPSRILQEIQCITNQ